MSSSTFFLLLEAFIKVQNDIVTNLKNDNVHLLVFFRATMCPDIIDRKLHFAIVDQILFEGNKMYLNAFERRIIPGTDALTLVDWPDRARSLPIDAQRNSLPIEVTTSPNQWSPIEAKTSANQSPTEAEICLFRIFYTNHSD